MTCDVVIAGAGPAGIATALFLQQRDPTLRIVVVDRATFPRDKPCGGGLTGHAALALAALQIPIPDAHVPAAHAVVKYGAFEREVAMSAPVAVIRRWDFDATLVQTARARGVEIREGCAAQRFEATADRVVLHTSSGPIDAAFLVGADGAGGVVRKQLIGDRLGPRRTLPRPIRLFRAELPDAPGRYAKTMLYDFSPMRAGLRGYLWIFPTPDGAQGRAGINVGLMHYPSADQPHSGKELVKMLDQWLAPHGVTLDGSERGWPVFGYDASLPLSAPRILLVGDAAGVDALTGEGIAVGMEHGAVAANAIWAARASGDVSLRGYGKAVRRATVGRELVLDGRLAKMLYAGEGYRKWLSLVLFDDKMLQLYAERVSGQRVLADESLALVGALMRHVLGWGVRRRRLDAALA